MAHIPDDDPPWLGLARAHLGTREIKGPRHHPKIMGWALRLARKHQGLAWIPSVYTGDEVPWCGLFVAEIMDQAGYDPPPRMLAARGWLAFGRPLSVPARGAIAVFQRKGGGHVGFLVGSNAGQLHVLGGNQGDQVSIRGFPPDRLVGLRWPATGPAPRPLPERAPPPVSTTEA